MLELSDIKSSQEELQDYYAQLSAQHVTPAWIGGGISIEPRSDCRAPPLALAGSATPVSPAPPQVALPQPPCIAAR